MHARWTLTNELQRKVQAMEMSCYRNIFFISYKDHITNEEVHNRIQQAIGPYEDLLSTVKRRKMKWYGHVSRKKKSKTEERREDNIREWTGLDFSNTQRVADDRQRWRHLVARSSVVLQRHPRVKGLMMMMMPASRNTSHVI